MTTFWWLVILGGVLAVGGAFIAWAACAVSSLTDRALGNIFEDDD